MQFVINRPMQRFWRSTGGKFGLTLTVLLVGAAVLVPLLWPYDPTTDQDLMARLMPPSSSHWFGTDARGRDILILAWSGLRTSLLVSLVSVALGLVIGVLLGLLAGYLGRFVDLGISWVTDILLAFPSILLAIAIVTVTGPSLSSAMVAIGIVQIPIYTRLTRAMALCLREQEFVQAAQALGASPVRILCHHILPASLAPIVVQATLSIGTATLEAAGLGFLGLGAQPPTPELGTMLADAFKGGYSLTAPWTTLFPGLLITLNVFAFNLLGDGLQGSLDPRSSK